MKEEIKKIKELIESLLERLTVSGVVDVVETADGPKFIIRTQEGGLLIGENGKNLISFNHILKKITSRSQGETEPVIFSLDVNDYQEKKMEELRNVARLNAQRVRYFKKEVILRPMSSFERRVIHATLADCPDIMTESQGREPERYLVIKPYI